MNSRKKRNRLLKRQDGVVALEFVVLFPLFLLIVAGIVEFGHVFYVRHTLTNATREGARAAVVYYSTDRLNNATNAANAAIINYLRIVDGKSAFLPGVTLDLHPPVPAGGTSPFFTGATAGSTVTVRITASNVLVVVDQIVTFPRPVTVTAETIMRLE